MIYGYHWQLICMNMLVDSAASNCIWLYLDLRSYLDEK